EGYLHGVGEGVEPALHSATGLLVEGNNLSHWRLDPPVLALARPARRPRRMAVIRGRSRHAPVQRLVSLTTIVTLSARVLTTLLALSPRECKKRFSARRAFRSQGKISRRGALPHAPGASDGSGRSNRWCSAIRAACHPLMPCTPGQGGVDWEHKYTPGMPAVY